MSLIKAYRGGDKKQRPGWWMHFIYEPEIVEQITRKIPIRWRDYDSQNMRWWIADEYMNVAIQIVPSLEAIVRQPQLF